MAFNPARPRESLGLPDDLYPGQALVQIEHPDPKLRAQYLRFGLVALIPLEKGRLQLPTPEVAFVTVDPDSPYAFALGMIRFCEEDGDVPAGSLREAYQALTDGTFDSTPWIAYLP